MCWNGKKEEWESCDPKDIKKTNWWNGRCSELCEILSEDSTLCNPLYNWMFLESLLNSSDLCILWTLKEFSFNISKLRWGWMCVNSDETLSVNCFANKSICWDWYVGENEKCDNCQVDLWDICMTNWDKTLDNPDCKCDECPEKLKDICMTNWDKTLDNPDCKCDECPEKLKDICMTNWDKTPDNPDIPNFPEESDDEWNVTNDNCNICPCEYADFSVDLIKWDLVRAKLWDKSLLEIYRYSNSVALENFLEL